MIDRLTRIRTRLAVLEQGYAVHVPCGSEAEPMGGAEPGARRYACCKCGRVQRGEVISPDEAATDPAADLRYLIELIDAHDCGSADEVHHG